MKKNIWEKIANQYNIPLEREFIIDEYGAGAIYKFTKKTDLCVLIEKNYHP